MKKKEVNTILEDDTKRKRIILTYAFFAFISILLAFVFLSIFNEKNKIQYAKYDESSIIDYKVDLKDNEFYEKKYLPSDKAYISSLIDYINATFRYKMTLDKNDVEYKYSYRIDAELKVIDKNSRKVLYSHIDELLPKIEQASDEQELTISENIMIDYNKYNDLIAKFKSTYDLLDADSLLNVYATINITGTCEDLDVDNSNESVMTLSIPLTSKTMNVELSNDLVDSQDNIMICSKPKTITVVYIIISLMLFTLSLIIILRAILYSRNTRTARSVYDKELKKILNNYGPYIQKVYGEFKLVGFQSIKIESFADMLEIRDTIQKPILLVENAKKDSSFFMIPSDDKLLYIYSIKMRDIQKELKNLQG
jgi:hypothetical protein